MKRSLIGYLSFSLLALPAVAFPSNQPGEFLLKMKEGRPVPTLGQEIKVRELLPGLYKLENLFDAKAINELKSDSEVQYLEPNHRGEKEELAQENFMLPLVLEDSKSTGNGPFNDPYVERLWAFAPGQIMGMSVNDAYVAFPRSDKSEVVVAVVDTGVDYTHPDMENQMWVNADEVPGNGIDDDSNGYIDDIHGINILVKATDGKPSGDPSDGHFHGTHVAGTIASAQNNGKAIAGVATKAKIMAIRAVPNQGDETDADVIEAFVYAAKNGAKLINCSFGKYQNEKGMAVSETIDYIGREYGVLVVAAAGNDTTDIDRKSVYPASYPNENLLVVAASSTTGKRAFFSNVGARSVDVAAPGTGIVSLAPGGGIRSLDGTSMATPNTVGVAAEVLSQFPTLTAVELKQVLMNSVSKSTQWNGKVVSGGIVNLEKALDAASLIAH